MHKLLQLKGTFFAKKAEGPRFFPYPKDLYVTSAAMDRLLSQLIRIQKYWDVDKLIGGALVSVHYKRIVPKSARLSVLLAEKGKKPDDSVRGAKFEPDTDGIHKRHVFTHFITSGALERSILILRAALRYVLYRYDGHINASDLERDRKSIIPDDVGISRNIFNHVILDCFHVSRFDIDRYEESLEDTALVTLYKTGKSAKALLADLGIAVSDDSFIGDTTVRLSRENIRLLQNKASYLIAMNVVDFARIPMVDYPEEYLDSDMSIRSPSHEPVIGVIDTQFNENVYFKEWVEYHNMLSPDIPLEPEDYNHGTEVTSIIVDGPRLNPRLEDHCGYFRVRHFGVAAQRGFSSFSVLKMIRHIVAENPDIKVWNLCLGSRREISESYISPEAAELDRIQNEYDVVFVVAGTNRPFDFQRESMKIGAPADSINSIVVNSVNFDECPASYTRSGPVLSFFHKPDVSFYGGDGSLSGDRIGVWKDDRGLIYNAGTSFAAPWISRKMAFMIYILGLKREVAKALLIDAAAKWASGKSISNEIGFGIVPTRIEDVIHAREDDEIRFIISGTTEAYETYNYNLPVPIVKGMQPFMARATMVYYPYCDRMQGVDYTTTEMDLHIGQLVLKDGSYSIKDIVNNKQTDPGTQVIYEEDARKLFRKWDNVKRVSEKVSKLSRGKKLQTRDGLWGIRIVTKERMGRHGRGLPFGLVVTLKGAKGIDCYDDFIKICSARGWLVNQIDIHNMLEIHVQGESEINFEN
jgi:hypothetical protein